MPEARASKELRSCVEPQCVDRALDLLRELWCEADDVPETDRTAFEIAAVEVMANIVQHSVSPDPLDVVMRVSVHHDCIEATFTDTGDRFETNVDVQHVPMPDPLREGGRGLALAGTVLDEIRYVREGRTNCWRLVRRLAT